jgi:hypothetical protein
MVEIWTEQNSVGNHPIALNSLSRVGGAKVMISPSKLQSDDGFGASAAAAVAGQ